MVKVFLKQQSLTALVNDFVINWIATPDCVRLAMTQVFLLME